MPSAPNDRFIARKEWIVNSQIPALVDDTKLESVIYRSRHFLELRQVEKSILQGHSQ